MRNRPTAQTAARFSVAAALVFSLLLAGSTCPGNVGSVFDPGQTSNPPGGGPGPGPGDGPRAAPIDGALIKTTAPALVKMAPVPGAIGVDVRAPVVLWFSETLNSDTLSTASLGLRESLSTSAVTHARLGFASDRCIALVPSANLAPNTVYEVIATDDVTDLDGQRLVVPATGVLGSFRTAAATTGVPPQVLGTFPPNGAVFEPNDMPLLIVFSKPVDFTTIAPPGVEITNTTGGMDGVYDPPFGYAGNRIVEYRHSDDGSDLGANMNVFVDTTVTDTEFVPLPLAATHSSNWSTLEFGPPVSLDVLGAPAVNLANLAAFPADVMVPPSVLATDTVHFRIYEALGSGLVFSTMPSGLALPIFSFVVDMEAAPEVGTLNDGPLVLASFVERAGLRTTTRVLNGFGQDTVRPELIQFGPPAGSVPSRFVSDVPELRPYGDADEAITGVEITYLDPGVPVTDTRIVPRGVGSGFFLGPAFDLALGPEAVHSFEVILTDAAENAMDGPVAGSAIFRGFVTGAEPLNSSVRVVAFNQRTLAPITGAKAFIENASGGIQAQAFTAADGSAVFPGRSGPQTVTITHPDFYAVSILQVSADTFSLPLREQFVFTRTISPDVSNVTGGIVRLASPLLRDPFNELRPDSFLDWDLDFPTAVNVRPDRPAWFASFYKVSGFAGDPQTGLYFERFALEPDRVVPPSSSGFPVVAPELMMEFTSNSQLKTTDYIYTLSPLGPGADFTVPVTRSTVAGMVKLKGLAGLAAVGTGALASPPNQAKLEIEVGLHEYATLDEGADPPVTLQVYAVDTPGNEALLRTETALVENPSAIGPLLLPAIPKSLAQGGAQPFASLQLKFSESLGGGEGYYRLVIEDSSPVPLRWDVWVPSGIVMPPAVPMPRLNGSANSPLALGSWTLFCEAYGMPPGFVESSFFFTELSRDNLSWARSIPGPAFVVTP